jgi:hypothetical protein
MREQRWRANRGAVRLSRPRVALRVALLAVGGAYMIWRGAEARSALGPLGGGEALLGSRLALVWILMGALALLTAAGGALSLRRRPPKRTLRLGDLTGAEAPGEGREGSPGASVREGRRERD